MTINLPPKDPSETIRYEADFSEQISPDAIASYTLTVESGSATIAKQVQSVRSVQFYVAGGTTGTTTVFLFTVTTNTSQVIERRYSVYVADNLSSFQTTSTTKRQLIEQVFSESALNAWELDITADEKDAALKRLDALMWELKGRGLNLNYNFPTGIGMGDLDDVLGCPDEAFFGLSIMAAFRFAPTMGKKMSAESSKALNDATKAVRAAASNYVPAMDLAPGTPIGAGNKPWSTRYPFSMTE